MELAPRPALLWTPDVLPQCPICQGDVYAEDVDLILDAGDFYEFDWTLGHCGTCGQWYGLLADLLDATLDEGLFPDAVEGFIVNEKRVEAGLLAQSPTGLIPWAAFREHAGTMSDAPTGPPPEPKEVQALPRLAQGWELGLRRGGYFWDEGTRTASFIALVLDPDAGIRQHNVKGAVPHTVDELADLLLQAAAHPHAGQPGRPPEVHLPDAELAEALARALTAAGIPIRSAPTPLADEVIEDMLRAIGLGTDDPYLSTHDDATVRSFFKAAKKLFKLRPWERIEPDRFIAFRLDDEEWHYLSIMGHMGEEYGLSLFDDWIHLCLFIHNQPTMFDVLMGVHEEKAFEAAEVMESLTLDNLDMLPAEDAEQVQRLGLKPVWKSMYPSVRRFSVDGQETPALSASAYRVLMEALAEAIEKRRAQTITSIKQSFEVDGTTVTFRYPSRGDESIDETAPGTFRLVVTGLDDDTINGKMYTRMEIDAPGTARLDDVAKAVFEATSIFYVTGVHTEDYAVWGLHERSGPVPRVAHLIDLPDLALEIHGEAYPMRLVPRVGTAQDEIQVRIVER